MYTHSTICVVDINNTKLFGNR